MTIRNWFAAMGLFVAVAAAAGGCQSHSDHADGTSGEKTMSASQDDCTHCAGNQIANANGKCPICGAQVK